MQIDEICKKMKCSQFPDNYLRFLTMLLFMRKEFTRIIILLMVCGVLTVYKRKNFCRHTSMRLTDMEGFCK